MTKKVLFSLCLGAAGIGVILYFYLSDSSETIEALPSLSPIEPAQVEPVPSWPDAAPSQLAPLGDELKKMKEEPPVDVRPLPQAPIEPPKPVAKQPAPQPVQTKPPKMTQAPAPVVSQINGQCWTVTYSHQNIESHRDPEVCAGHRNQFEIPLNHGVINPASICVRVQGAPVSFKSVSPQNNVLQIGPGPHLKSDVTILYCNNKVLCDIPCEIRKDDFISSLAGDQVEEKKIDAKNKKQKPKANDSDGGDEKVLEGEINSLQKETGWNQGSDESVLFKGWIHKLENEVCQSNRKVGG